VSTPEIRTHVAVRLSEAGIVVSEATLDRLDVYFRLLCRWNEKTNLTGFDLRVPSPAALDRLLVEPLAAAAKLTGPPPRIIDIGSGGGSPAIPMAIATAAVTLTLVEATSKKAVFLREALRALAMDGAQVIASRYEDVVATAELRGHFDVLTARAIRLDGPAIADLQVLVKPGGRILLFRSDNSEPLIRSLRPPVSHASTRPLIGAAGSRLVVLEKAAVVFHVKRLTTRTDRSTVAGQSGRKLTSKDRN
jgi:16S rRNA (guanine527-N7)-methyltransferase